MSIATVPDLTNRSSRLDFEAIFREFSMFSVRFCDAENFRLKRCRLRLTGRGLACRLRQMRRRTRV